MTDYHSYIVNGKREVVNSDFIANLESIKLQRLIQCISRNPDTPVNDIVKYLKSDGSVSKSLLFPVYRKNSVTYETAKVIATRYDIKTETLLMDLKRHPKLTAEESAQKIKKNKNKRQKNQSLEVIANANGIPLKHLKETMTKFKDKLSQEQIIEIACVNYQSILSATLLQNSKAGLWKERRGRHYTWVAIYNDENMVEREMTAREIAEVEGLNPNSLNKAIKRYQAKKSIYEIVQEMAGRNEKTALYDLAEVHGVDRRMFIHRLNKHQGSMSLDMIIKLTQDDQKRLRLTPKKERNEPLPLIDGMTMSKFGTSNGMSAKTVIRRFDSGIQPKYTLGRRSPISSYDFDGISLTMTELTLVSGLKPQTIRTSIIKHEDETLPFHLKMSVDEFHAKVKQLEKLWCIPQRNIIRLNSRLFTLGVMTFTTTQLCQIGDVAESTIRNRAKKTNSVLAITKLSKQIFMERVAKIEDERAKALDSVTMGNDFVYARERENKLRIIKNNYSKAKRESQRHLNELKNLDLPLISNNFGVNHLQLVPCSKCFSAPSMEVVNDNMRLSCSNCGHGNENEPNNYIDTVLDWSNINIDTLNYSDINCFHKVDIKSLGDIKRGQFLNALDGYYKNEHLSLNQLLAAFDFPPAMRKQFDVFDDRRRLAKIKHLEMQMKIVNLLKNIHGHLNLWSHMSL